MEELHKKDFMGICGALLRHKMWLSDYDAKLHISLHGSTYLPDQYILSCPRYTCTERIRSRSQGHRGSRFGRHRPGVLPVFRGDNGPHSVFFKDKQDSLVDQIFLPQYKLFCHPFFSTSSSYSFLKKSCSLLILPFWYSS